MYYYHESNYNDSLRLGIESTIHQDVIYYEFINEDNESIIYAFDAKTDKKHLIENIGQAENKSFLRINNTVYFGYISLVDKKLRLLEIDGTIKRKIHKSSMTKWELDEFKAGDKEMLYILGTGPSGWGVYSFNSKNGFFELVFKNGFNGNGYVRRLNTVGDSAIMYISETKILIGKSANTLRDIATTPSPEFNFNTRYRNQTFFYDFYPPYGVYRIRKGERNLKRIATLGAALRFKPLNNGLFASIRVLSEPNVINEFLEINPNKDAVTTLFKINSIEIMGPLVELDSNLIGLPLINNRILIHNLTTNKTRIETSFNTGMQDPYHAMNGTFDPINSINYFAFKDRNSDDIRFFELSKDGTTLKTITDTIQRGFIHFSNNIHFANGNLYFFTSKTNGVHLFKLDLSLSSQKHNHEGLGVFPSPTSQMLNIDLKDDNPAYIEIIDINGKVLIKRSTTQKHERIDVSTLPNSIYTIKAVQSGTTFLSKFIKK